MTDFDAELEGFETTLAGLKEFEEDWSESPVYITGTNVEYSVYLELGTSKMPSYPWVRPAIKEFKRDPEAFILKNSRLGGLDEIESTDELIKTVAFCFERQLKENVSADRGTGRSPGTHPAHPMRESSTLVNSIRAVRVK